MAGRHYATLWKGSRFRKYRVVRADVTRESVRGRMLTKIRYTTVSRHWTFAAAAKESTHLNSTGGNAQ